jgi:non-ribosomal peptide synthase protein (TIGR01720 family)
VAGGRLNVEWNYSRGLHRRESVERVAQYLIAELRSLVEHCRGETAGGFTPSDFPLSRLTQAQIDRLAKLRGQKTAHT